MGMKTGPPNHPRLLLRDKPRLSAVPVLPRVAPPAISGPSGPSGPKVKEKAGGLSEGYDPTGKKKPGGWKGGNRKPTSEGGSRRGGYIPVAQGDCTSEGGKKRMMEVMGGLNFAEELALAECIGLAEGVPQSRMRRVYARSASPIPSYHLLSSGWPVAVITA